MKWTPDIDAKMIKEIKQYSDKVNMKVIDISISLDQANQINHQPPQDKSEY